MEINISQVLFQAVNFGIIMFVLNKYLYKPVKEMLENREKKINEGLAAAERNLKAEADVEKRKKDELGKARREAAKIIADAKIEAKKQAEAYLEKAKAEAKKEAGHILDAAQTSVKEEKRALQSSLKDLVVETTKKLLAETLTAKEVEKITSGMVAKIK